MSKYLYFVFFSKNRYRHIIEEKANISSEVIDTDDLLKKLSGNEKKGKNEK